MKLYVLHHVHAFDDGTEDLKLIGVYSSKERARRAKHHVKDAPGFRDAPTGFRIDRYSLDHNGSTDHSKGDRPAKVLSENS